MEYELSEMSETELQCEILKLLESIANDTREIKSDLSKIATSLERIATSSGYIRQHHVS